MKKLPIDIIKLIEEAHRLLKEIRERAVIVYPPSGVEMRLKATLDSNNARRNTRTP